MGDGPALIVVCGWIFVVGAGWDARGTRVGAILGPALILIVGRFSS